MYFIGLVLFLTFLVFSTLFSGSPNSFIDLPSLIIILAFCIPTLMASGLFSDFVRGFKVMGQKVNTWSVIELKKTETALNLMIKLLLLSGLLGFMVGIVAFLPYSTEIGKLGANLAVSLITPLYSVIIVFILLPVQAKVKAIVLTMDKE